MHNLLVLTCFDKRMNSFHQLRFFFFFNPVPVSPRDLYQNFSSDLFSSSGLHLIRRGKEEGGGGRAAPGIPIAGRITCSV